MHFSLKSNKKEEPSDLELNEIHETERISHPLMEYYRHVYKDSPRWDGKESLEGAIIIVYFEQGMGDCLQFLRYIPHLKEKYNPLIYLHLPKELHWLVEKGNLGYLTSTKKWFNLLAKDDPSLPEHDYHILSMSLPFLLGDFLKDRGYSAHTQFPYLGKTVKREDLEKYPSPKIGICWEGNPNNKVNSIRSVPAKYFKPLQEFATLFALQRRIHDSFWVKDCEDLKLFSIDINDYYDTASLIKQLDLVISVDTSVFHLAGAMGKNTILLLSNQVTDGRYGMEGKTTRWYKNVTIYRNDRKDGWWGDVMEEVVGDLRKKFVGENG